MNYCNQFQTLDFEKYLAELSLTYDEFKAVFRQEIKRKHVSRLIKFVILAFSKITRVTRVI